MPFADFHGNAELVRTVREMLTRGHFPHAVILSGPQGSGKFTLAQMIAKTMNCLERPSTDGLPDFCGRCANCVRIAKADSLEQRFAEAVDVRENMRDADKRDTRIFVQTHPDVLIIPPDPPQMLVKVDQVRHVISEIYYKPADGRERVCIFSHAEFHEEQRLLSRSTEEPERHFFCSPTIPRPCCRRFARAAHTCVWRHCLRRKSRATSHSFARNRHLANALCWRGFVEEAWARLAPSISPATWPRGKTHWLCWRLPWPHKITVNCFA